MYMKESRNIVKGFETTKITNWMTNTSLDLYMGKVNGCSKDIGLRNFFRNFLWGKKINIDFFANFLYFS